MNRIFLMLTLLVLGATQFCYSQDGNFINLTFNNIIKAGGAAEYYGWGVSSDNLLDPRPNSVSGGAFLMNHHQGLTFSAHSHYGGIRFYNQSYPGGPYDSSNGATMVMSIKDRSVGIGSTDPITMFTLKRMVADGDQISIYRGDNTPNLDVYSVYNGSSDAQSGSFAYGVRPATDSWEIWERGHNTNWTNLFAVKKDGNVGIGTATPAEKLSVNGKIRAHEVKVETANWPDYVFARGYQLPSLQETEKHIKDKGHLPGIPSAAKVKANGIDLGEMNAKLLQKIEELTLHLIEKDKEIKQLNKLNDRITELELKIGKLADKQ
ncbi:hypothetical protein D3C87_1294600 [compost metagenome]